MRNDLITRLYAYVMRAKANTSLNMTLHKYICIIIILRLLLPSEAFDTLYIHGKNGSIIAKISFENIKSHSLWPCKKMSLAQQFLFGKFQIFHLKSSR